MVYHPNQHTQNVRQVRAMLILLVLRNVSMTYNVTSQKTAHFLQKIREKAKNRQYLTENVHIW